MTPIIGAVAPKCPDNVKEELMGSTQIAAVTRALITRVEIMPNVCGLIAFIFFSIAGPDKRYMIGRAVLYLVR